jgi:hypothetical protein
MKRLLALGVVSLFVGMTFIGMSAMTLSGGQGQSGKDRDVDGGIRDRFV